MATQIIDQPGQPRQYTGVSVDKTCWWCDQYTGTVEALVTAGIITLDQLPGQPGGPKVAATYYAGVLRPPKGHTPKDEHYLNITRPKNCRTIKVVVGLSKEEATRREERQNAVRAAEKQVRTAALNNQREEYRATGKRLAWMLWKLASTDHRGAHWSLFNLELSADGSSELNGMLSRIWDVFDRDPLQDVSSLRSAAIAAANDKKFQDFLAAQCIATEGRNYE
ncbi:hypothetical protein [Variovorax guangxiensis]|uniref:Uncharacterized protein n=1 Tax=Variovorax guangxiensis TaxID=1775474 RepID=A0A840FUZ6_9BURK|nr:hypothetical protein [Variovorax guangxiensis]MBB4226013.1 hypothetical protein [Variovorax guangxiensis]